MQDYSRHKILWTGAINFTHFNCGCYTCSSRAKTCGKFNTCLQLDKKNLQLHSKYDYEIIKQEDKDLYADQDPLSSILNQLFKKFKVPFGHVYIINIYTILCIILSENTLLFCFICVVL